jgi:hypothetical protein
MNDTHSEDAIPRHGAACREMRSLAFLFGFRVCAYWRLRMRKRGRLRMRKRGRRRKTRLCFQGDGAPALPERVPERDLQFNFILFDFLDRNRNTLPSTVAKYLKNDWIAYRRGRI